MSEPPHPACTKNKEQKDIPSYFPSDYIRHIRKNLKNVGEINTHMNDLIKYIGQLNLNES